MAVDRRYSLLKHNHNDVYPLKAGNETITGNWTFTGTTVVPEATVTAHEAALSIAGPQVNSGTLPDARLSSNVVVNKATSGFYFSEAINIADDATLEFDTNIRNGIVFISNTFNVDTQVIFMHEDSTTTKLVSPASSLVSLGVGTNPDVDGDVNIWMSGADRISIKNRLGSTRAFTLFAFGEFL